MKRLACAIIALCAASPAAAQDQIGVYSTLLGPSDMFNSQGTRLTDLCTVVQQDRANFHRFGIRDEYDRDDPFFANREARARIPSICSLQPGYDYIAQSIRRGEPRFVSVVIYGSKGVPSRIVVTEGAG